ncbi:Abi family protein [Cedecea davisae]|uniref:Abi family protein n=1 Tax=Cedecea davisae TaxID=158484 RepID=A0ABS6DDJ1_9ENTR|nr:Abi family protein [Cedecea davisae]MBU4681248.1 Abi family protein [Cedecea davisae]MBU4686326.1 Abi family protein [Cedecea davisae]
MTVENIAQSITPSRLATYERCFSTRDTTECLGLYIWNKRVSAEFLPVLQILEVSLRNAVCSGHAALSREELTKKGVAHEDVEGQLDLLWFKSFFDAASHTGKYKISKKAINDATVKLEKEGLAVTANNLIPLLTFGVWSHICQEHDETSADSLKLWPKMMHHAFPGSKITHGEVVRILRVVNKLRNRIAHHEPIWYSKELYGVKAHLNKVINMYKDCLVLIKAINPSNLKAIELVKSHESLTNLCTVTSINTFKAMATNIETIPVINIDSWYRSQKLSVVVKGEIASINGVVVKIRLLDEPGTGLFEVESNERAVKQGLRQLYVGEIVNFVPGRRGTKLLATKVHYGLPQN